MSERLWYRADTSTFTAGVVVQDGVIVHGAPILKRFHGQPLANLERWVKRLGGTVEPLARGGPVDVLS